MVKYNTKYRQIPSQGSKPKAFTEILDANLFHNVFERLKRDVNLAIKNKSKFKIREKDVNSLWTIEPAAQKFKFQTRD